MKKEGIAQKQEKDTRQSLSTVHETDEYQIKDKARQTERHSQGRRRPTIIDQIYMRSALGMETIQISKLSSHSPTTRETTRDTLKQSPQGDLKLDDSLHPDIAESDFQEEVKIFRPFVFAQILVLFILGVLYLNYLLIGQFFQCFFLSYITSVALRAQKIQVQEYISQSLEGPIFIMEKSYIFLVGQQIWLLLVDFYMLRSMTIPFYNLYQKLASSIRNQLNSWEQNKTTIFNDLWSIIIITLIYISYFKIGIRTSTRFFVYYQIIDFIVRLFFYVVIQLHKHFTVPQWIFCGKKQKLLNGLDQSLTQVIILVFGVLMALIIFLFFILLRKDIVDLQDYVSDKFGVQNLLLRMNISSIDQEFSKYAAQSFAYIKDHTNITLPIRDNQTFNSVNDIHALLIDIMSNHEDIQRNFLTIWNMTIGNNTQYIKNSIFSSFIPEFVQYQLAFFWTVLSQFNIATLAKKIMDFLFQVNSGVFSIVVFSFSSILAWLLTLSNVAFTIFLYFTILSYLLHQNEDLASKIFKIIPFEQETREHLVKTLNSSISGVFLSSIKVAVYQALYTWMIFDLVSLKYITIYSIFVAVFKLIPIVSPLVICFIACLQMYFQNGNHLIVCLGTFVVYALVDMKLADDIYRREVDIANSYIIGMSVFMGYYAFDLQGIFYGPLVVLIASISYDMFQKGNQNQEDFQGNSDLAKQKTQRKLKQT